MKKVRAFWDSSALVALCVREAASRQAHVLLRRYDPVVWWGSPVEVRSAVCRLHRDGELNDAGKQGALARLQFLERAWREVLPDDSLRDLAVQCLDRYILRAADSLQLAAAMVWCQNRPRRHSFICADRRLSLAAAAAGFNVLGVPVAAP